MEWVPQVQRPAHPWLVVVALRHLVVASGEAVRQGMEVKVSEYTLWIAGSRGFETWRGEHIFDRYAEEACDALGGRPTRVIHGGCPTGIDSLGDEWARAWSIPVDVYLPDHLKWGGNRAYFERNKLCRDKSDKALMIWDGKSKGTRLSIDLALNVGMPMVLYTLRGWS